MFEDIAFLLKASKFCFGTAVFFLLLAVLLFFLFDIRSILMIETGSGRRKTVQEMHERNQRTGKLRTESDLSSGGTTKENTGKVKTSGRDSKETTRKQNTDSKGSTQSTGSGTKKDGTQKFDTGRAYSPGEPGNQKSLETVYLEEASPGKGYNFKVTQKLIVIHTDENIPA